MYQNKIIIETLHDKFQRLAYQANNDVFGFKLVLSLIILLDLSLWADFISEEEEILLYLKKLQHRLVVSNPGCFIIPNGGIRRNVYTNVNIPQEKEEWDRVEDKGTYVKLQELSFWKQNIDNPLVGER